MGAPKLLLPFRGSTVIGATVSALRDGGVERIVVVTAPGNSDLEAFAAGQGLELALNPQFERGMLSTLWAGIAAFGGGPAAQTMATPLVICPADLPLLRGDTVKRVIAALSQPAGAWLAQPRYGGQSGHPLAIAPALVPEILTLDLEVGLRQLRERHAQHLVILEVDDPGCVRDVDTPEDYAALSRGEDWR